MPRPGIRGCSLTVWMLLLRAASPALSQWSGLEANRPRLLRRRQRDQRFGSLHTLHRLDRFGEKPFEIARGSDTNLQEMIPDAGDVMAFQHVGGRLHLLQKYRLDLRVAPTHHDEGEQIEPHRFRRDAGVKAGN